MSLGGAAYNCFPITRLKCQRNPYVVIRIVVMAIRTGKVSLRPWFREQILQCIGILLTFNAKKLRHLVLMFIFPLIITLYIQVVIVSPSYNVNIHPLFKLISISSEYMEGQTCSLHYILVYVLSIMDMISLVASSSESFDLYYTYLLNTISDLIMCRQPTLFLH